MILSCLTNVFLVSCHPLMNKYTVETALLRKYIIFKIKATLRAEALRSS